MKRKRRHPDALLERSILLDEREGPPLVRGAVLFGAVVVLLFVAWAANAGLEEIELASGEIVTTDETVKLQHPTGGLVLEIKVREGSRVEAGDLLLRMDAADSETQRKQWNAQILSLRAQRERLSALILARESDFSFLPASASQFAADQKAIHDASLAKTKLSLDIFDSQIEQVRDEMTGLSDRREALARQISLAEEDASITLGLVDSRMAAKSELLAKLRGLESLKEEAESLSNQSTLAAHRLSQTEDKRLEYLAEEGRQYKTELASIDDRIAQAGASLERLESAAGRLELRSPVPGLVHALNYRTASMVIPGGAVIMEIIPVGKTLKAQLRIDPKSIGSVAEGQPARLKISAYPYDRYGAFKGRLSEISPATFIGADGRPYYRGSVEIEGRELESATALDLVPGMTLIAELRTGKKTLLQYLLKPIYASAREAFREK